MRTKYSELMKMSNDEFADKLKNDINIHLDGDGVKEINSWLNTLDYLKNTPLYNGNDFYINFEFPVPFCGERIDCIIESNERLFVLEFKQWKNDDEIINYDSDYVIYYGQKRRNPFSQVLQYCRTLFFTNKDLYNKKIILIPIVVMPNYEFKDSMIEKNTKKEYYEKCYKFDINNRMNFNDLLANYTNEPILPLEFTNILSLNDILANNKIPYINDEFVIFNNIIKSLNKHRDVIVKGTAGSGKTVLALCLLNEIINNERNTGNFVNLQFATVDGKGKNILYGASQELIKSFENQLINKIPNTVFKSFWSSVRNTIGSTIQIFDESQRMTLEQVQMVIQNKPTLETQLIWFIDDTQSIEVGEDNSVYNILNEYKKIYCECDIYSLENQFRCSGDYQYINDLKKLINLNNTSLKKYQVFITDDIDTALVRYETYPKKQRGVLYTDSWKSGNISIGTYNRQSLNEFGKWQADVDDTPASVFKAQGCEKDYILFLWGKDFVIRNNVWQIQRSFVRNKRWNAYYNNMPLLYEKMKAIIYVLMTRHKKELIIYFDDSETYRYFKDKIRKVGEENGKDGFKIN